MNMGFRVTQ